MTCNARHTKYQPTDEEFRCPKCGAGPEEGFIIDDSPEDADSDCGLLHEDDCIVCNNCKTEHHRDTDYSGKSYAALMVKKNNLVPCPHCKGKGLVKGDPK